MNLAPVNRHFARGFDPESHLVSADLHHGNDNRLIDDDTFVLLSRQNQHGSQLRNGYILCHRTTVSMQLGDELFVDAHCDISQRSILTARH